MDAAEVAALFESPCSLIVAAVDSEGMPHAVRGWGITLTDAGRHARILVSAAAHRARAAFADTNVIAVTGTDVPSNVSVQLKGQVLALEDEAPDDRARREQYADAFFRVIHDADGAAIDLLERLQPRECFAVSMAVLERFDQTPGPRAGRSLLDARA
jgi:hypothetical protein